MPMAPRLCPEPAQRAWCNLSPKIVIILKPPKAATNAVQAVQIVNQGDQG